MPTGSRHIAFFCSRLDMPGGIERAVVNTANLFVSHGNTVTLIVMDSTKESFYPVNSLIHFVQHPFNFGISTEGNKFSRKRKFINDIFDLKRVIKRYRPEIIITTEYPIMVATVLAGARRNANIYAWEHHHHAWLEKSFFWKKLCNYAYPKMDGIVCLNRAEAAYYEKKASVSVIPNFVDIPPVTIPHVENKMILSIGWLIPRKGIDYIMQTASRVLKQHPDWTWKLIGTGEMKQEVLQFIEKENLQGRFILQTPENEKIGEDYRSASIFVLASRFEAFPMVLLESMSNGLPCISFDCPSGPSEIIRHEEDGLLVEKENPEALTAAVNRLVIDTELRNNMREKARENIQRFSGDNVYQKWLDIFKK